MTDLKKDVELPQRHLVIVRHDTKNGLPGQPAGPTWSQQIYVPFVPDTVIIRQAVYCRDNTEADVYCFMCSSLSTTFGALLDAVVNAPNITIDLRGKTVNSRWQFELQHLNGSVAAAAEGEIAAVLEFIKH